MPPPPRRPFGRAAGIRPPGGGGQDLSNTSFLNEIPDALAHPFKVGFSNGTEIVFLMAFFILFEAMQQTEGLKLGLLGSIIVSEVIFGALASCPPSASGGSLTDQLDLVSREFYRTNVLQSIPDISSMAQLVEFTTEVAELRQAVPAFL